MSNQTATGVWLTGQGLTEGARLTVGGQTVALTVLDDGHAFGWVPPLPLPEHVAEATVPFVLDGRDAGVSLHVVNDVAFPTPTGLVGTRDGRLFTAVPSQDVVLQVSAADGGVQQLGVGDGPSALAVWETDGGEVLVVAHAAAPELRLLPRDGEGVVLPAPAYAAALVVKNGVAFLAEQARDSVVALELPGGKELWRTPVAPNPGALAFDARGLAVGSLQTGELEWLDPKTGALLGRAEPGPGTPIIGGGTQAFSSRVMNGSAVRALAAWPKTGQLLAATIGPNVGPNPEKMEVSMNGGLTVGVAAKASPAIAHHLGFGAGVTQAVAVDAPRGLVYAADVALGLVRVLDGSALVGPPSKVGSALLQEVAMPVPDGFPLVRDAADFGVGRRAGRSVHAGPSALWLSADGATLWVLDRFTLELVGVDVRGAKAKQATVARVLPLGGAPGPSARRLGEILYFADLGRTGMSCDACHPSGHTGGVMFEKTKPLRIYRSPTVRNARDTPPYFTPASTKSLAETAKVVGSRNRFHAPDLTDAEVDALTTYTAAVLLTPNPSVREAKGLPATVTLPDGRVGRPREGAKWFLTEGQCAGCHPWPVFTTDQQGETRGRFQDVGTPRLMPLREPMQDPHFSGFAPPSLLGGWDVFPMLTTGLAGLETTNAGAVRVGTRFPLRRAVEAFAPTHGRADVLSEEARDDLLAFLQCL